MYLEFRQVGIFCVNDMRFEWLGCSFEPIQVLIFIQKFRFESSYSTLKIVYDLFAC